MTAPMRLGGIRVRLHGLFYSCHKPRRLRFSMSSVGSLHLHRTKETYSRIRQPLKVLQFVGLLGRKASFLLQINESCTTPVGLGPVYGNGQEVAQPVEFREVLGEILGLLEGDAAPSHAREQVKDFSL